MLEMQEKQGEKTSRNQGSRWPEMQHGPDSQQHREGTVARMIEEQTAKLPSDIFLWGALGAMACSCFLYMSGKKHESLFVGQWPAPFLLMGLYNKIVKVAGSDRTGAHTHL